MCVLQKPSPLRGEGWVRGMPLAFRLALRELRGGLSGFRIFLACLTIGVAAIAGVGSLSLALQESLRENAQVLLGGDVEFRVTGRKLDPAIIDDIRARSEKVAPLVEMRAMAYSTADNKRTLVGLKGVPPATYPLYGRIELAPDIALADAVAERNGRFGAVVGSSLLLRLGVAIGDSLRIGDATYEIRASIVTEPDQLANAFTLGPRIMVNRPGFTATGLVREGSLIRYKYKVRLADGSNAHTWGGAIGATYPQQSWRIRDTSRAQPGVRRFVERLAVFLTLVGVTALLIGGIGVGNAIQNFLAGKTEVIAVLKCIGARGRLIFEIYLIQVMLLASVGIAIGVVLGAGAPQLANAVLADKLPVVATAGLYWQPALMAAIFGWLTALVFALWPLASAQEVPAAGLFRDIVQPARRWPRPIYLVAIGIAATALALLAIFGSGQPYISRWFVLGAVGSLFAFRALAWLIVWSVRRIGRTRNPTLRLALTNICRPGAPTGGIVVSLGAGLTVLVAVALIQSNLTRQVTERIPLDAPAFFFINIQPGQGDAFADTVKSVAGAGKVVRVPMLRGRITRVNGTAVAQVKPDPDAAWVIRGEIGFTYSGPTPEGTDLRRGDWWPIDYSGPPLVSLDIDIARGLGVDIGDTMTYSILGREITARIKNLRKSDWMNLGINFVTVFAPGALENAPQSLLATAQATPEAEEAVFRAVTDRFPNISPIRVRAISERIASFFRQIGAGVQAASAVALLTGILVLAGAVAAGHRRRVYDAVVLKVLGATRGDLVKAFLLEYVLLGLSTAIIAVGVGSLAGWVVVTEVMRSEWEFLPGTAALTVIGGSVLTALLGFAGVWLALGQKPAPILRAE